MKKIIFLLILALGAMSANAQQRRSGAAYEVQPSVIGKVDGGRQVTRNPYYDDDIYYRSERKGNTGRTETGGDAACYVGDGGLEYSRQGGVSVRLSYGATVVSRHRIWQYRGVKGHYSFVDVGSSVPVVDVSYLNNVPRRLDLHEHLRATHQWNGNATYVEYLGGAIRGTPNEAEARFSAFCKNLDGSDVVYRDMRYQMARGYSPSAAEQKWMRRFEQDIRAVGLGYVDGKLVPVQSPQSLSAQWYGTSDCLQISQILQARAQRYNGY